jgi:hypothetical protein
MESLKLECPWEEVKETLKEAQVYLTDEDLEYDGKDAGPLLERLAAKMNRTTEQVRVWIESASHTRGIAS